MGPLWAKFEADNIINCANIEERVTQLFANRNIADADRLVTLCDSFVHMEQALAQFFNNDLQHTAAASDPPPSESDSDKVEI
jgi:hypothetical protein